MKYFYSVFFVIVLAFSFIGCDNPASVSNGSAPTITDIKISSSLNILTPDWVTTLSVGQKYYPFIYASDMQLDISQLVMTFTDGTQTLGPTTVPAIGQTAVSDVFVMTGGLVPQSIGNWTASVYLVDSEGNKSNTKTITVTVN
jgi:hypothetical protein